MGSSKNPTVSIIIPNWNGEKLIRKNLPKVLAAIRHQRSGISDQASVIRKELITDHRPPTTEIVIVDDGSEDGSKEYLKSQKSKVETATQNLKLKIIENKKNRGFIYSCNRGVKEAKGEIVVLLNNDVVPEKDFLKYALPHFEDPKVFAVSFHEPDWSWAKVKWEKGFVEHSPGPKGNKVHLSAWASGGSGAFRKSIWQKLGGFDFLYHPFYWEDFDLSYRAWKRGYKILWEPKAVVYHKHESTIGCFSKDYVNMISQRNQLLFIWKNISDPKMILEHKFWLGRKLLIKPGYWKPFLAALVEKPQIWPRWFRERREKKISDREILNKFS